MSALQEVLGPYLWQFPPKMLLYVIFFLLLLHNICTNALTVAPEECQSRALAPEEGFEGLATMDFDADGANY